MESVEIKLEQILAAAARHPSFFYRLLTVHALEAVEYRDKAVPVRTGQGRTTSVVT